MIRYICLVWILFMVSFASIGAEINIAPKNTLSVVEIDKGDKVNYTLQDGRIVKIELLDTRVDIILTSLDTLKKSARHNGTIYSMTAHLRIDGQEMRMVRYVPVQESFYEPYIVNGLVIWFDALKSLSEYFNENHGPCLPERDARFALHDATMSICPEEVGNWMNVPDEQLLVRKSYSGEDTWLGTYFGADLHGGLDYSMTSNTTLFAPFSLDEHFYFHSLTAGHNNNRWRGIKNWGNGDIWHIQTHHLVQLIAPEHQPLRKGQPYAYSGAIRSGYTSHTHFVLKVKQPGMDWHFMDPWVIFWQIFENNKRKENKINAVMAPLRPGKTGERIQFSSTGSRPGVWGNSLQYSWDFGDGWTSPLPNPDHTYVKPGIYPVTLRIDDGHRSDTYRQFITISGLPKDLPDYSVKCQECPSFQAQGNWRSFAYTDGTAETNTVTFNGYKWQDTPFSNKKVIVSGQNLEWKGHRIDINYIHGEGWLKVSSEIIENNLELTFTPLLEKIENKHGFYEAYLIIHHGDAVNPTRQVKIRLEIDEFPPGNTQVVDNVDAEYSPFFWLTPAFHFGWAKGYQGTFFVNKDNSAGEYVRYTPNLTEGIYKIKLEGRAFENEMLLSRTNGFYVLIKHKNGIDKKWIEPSKSLEIGEFVFSKGKEGFVEIITDDSKGLIIADAISFSPS
ncbi:MAG: PKD domain-containing protein [Cyclobacteriaceae bacterium]|nr:PKD domain-containing protein [Cyclobacteriaceae bacterium SS2]